MKNNEKSYEFFLLKQENLRLKEENSKLKEEVKGNNDKSFYGNVFNVFLSGLFATVTYAFFFFIDELMGSKERIVGTTPQLCYTTISHETAVLEFVGIIVCAFVLVIALIGLRRKMK